MNTSVENIYSTYGRPQVVSRAANLKKVEYLLLLNKNHRLNNPPLFKENFLILKIGLNDTPYFFGKISKIESKAFFPGRLRPRPPLDNLLEEFTL